VSSAAFGSSASGGVFLALEYVQRSTNAASMHTLQVHDIATPQVTCGAGSAATMQCQPFAVSCFSLSYNNTLEGLLGI